MGSREEDFNTGSTRDVRDEPGAPRADRIVDGPDTRPGPLVKGPTPTVPVDEAVTSRRDRIRWGPVWAGFLVSIALYLMIQLALVATGAIDLGATEQRDAWLSAGAALVAFFIGGLTTGASTVWNKIEDGILHGVVVWAVAVVAVLVLSVVASGITLGALDATGAFEDVTVELDDGTIDGVETALGAEDAEEAASWVLLGLSAALLALVLGTAAGSALWPRRHDVRLDELPLER